MSLVYLTQLVMGQLSLWRMLTQPKPPNGSQANPVTTHDPHEALERILNHSELSRLILSDTQSVNRVNIGRLILNALNFFSTCRRYRGLVRYAIDWLKSLVASQDELTLSPFCWDIMEYRPVGDHAMVVWNYFRFSPGMQRQQFNIRFKEIIAVMGDRDIGSISHVTAWSTAHVIDLNRPIGQFSFTDACQWTTQPVPLPVMAFGNIFLRFQQTGLLYEMLKYGFFSSMANRALMSQLVMLIGLDNVRHLFVVHPMRLRGLEEFSISSFGIMDLTRALPGEAVPFMQQLTGLHVGLNQRDIANWNLLNEGAELYLYPPAA